jgi:hypothetical protein
MMDWNNDVQHQQMHVSIPIHVGSILSLPRKCPIYALALGSGKLGRKN